MSTNPLVGGGVLDGVRYLTLFDEEDEVRVERSSSSGRSFATTTVPHIEADTIIVAAASPGLSRAHPKYDGWFLSDFYAFNYLLKGLGSSQTWLTAVDPRRLLTRWPGITEFLHGNPYQDRKVVLSQELLDNDELTPVIIETENMIQRFVDEVKLASAEAVRHNRPLLLMVFCHGLPDHSLQLNHYNNTTALRISQLKEAVADGCRVTLLTTACYSGGWAAVNLNRPEHNSVSDAMNLSLLAAASCNDLSISWPQSNSIGKRAYGSVFTSAVIERLTHESSDLLAQNVAGAGPANHGAPLQPGQANTQQVKTYNEFCRSILDTVRYNLTRLWEHHTFTFAAKDDQFGHSWTGQTSIPIRQYQQRWDALRVFPYTGPMNEKDTKDPSPSNSNWDSSTGTSQTGSASHTVEMEWLDSAHQHRLKTMARIYLEEACPGDSSRGYGQRVAGLLDDAINGTPTLDGSEDEDDVENQVDVAAMLCFRVGMGRLADLIVSTLELPVPSGKLCLVWHEFDWIHQSRRLIRNFDQHHNNALGVILGAGVEPQPTIAQGPPFDRFSRYLAAAITETVPTDERRQVLVKQMALLTQKLESQACDLVMENQGLRDRGRDWLKSVGRRVRRSLSPRKSHSRRSSEEFRDREDRTYSPRYTGDLLRRSTEFLRRSNEYTRDRGNSTSSPRRSGEQARGLREPVTSPRQSSEFTRRDILASLDIGVSSRGRSGSVLEDVPEFQLSPSPEDRKVKRG